MAPPDRDAILRRRAIFVASALGGVTVVHIAAAQEPPPGEQVSACPPAEPPDAAAKTEARELLKRGQIEYKVGNFPSALDHFRRAYEIAPIARLLLMMAQVEQAAGDAASAVKNLKTFLRCAPEDAKAPEARELLVKLESEMAWLTFQGMDGFEVELDGVKLGVLPLAEPIPVAAGRHELSFARSDCEGKHTHRVELGRGDRVTIGLEIPCERPMPCLEPCLQPCLSPPPPGNDPVARVGVGLGPLGLFDLDRSRNHALGARAEVFYYAPLGKKFAVSLGISGLLAVAREGVVVPVGPEMEAAFRVDAISIGLGVSGGYAFSSFEQSENSDYRPVSSPFVHAYLLPFSARLGDHTEVGSQLGLMFSRQESRDESRFGPSAATFGLFVRVLFGDPYGHGDDAELMARWRRAGFGQLDPARY